MTYRTKTQWINSLNVHFSILIPIKNIALIFLMFNRIFKKINLKSRFKYENANNIYKIQELALTGGNGMLKVFAKKEKITLAIILMTWKMFL